MTPDAPPPWRLVLADGTVRCARVVNGTRVVLEGSGETFVSWDAGDPEAVERYLLATAVRLGWRVRELVPPGRATAAERAAAELEALTAAEDLVRLVVESARVRLAARALYGMDDAGVLARLTPEMLRTASRRLGWTLAREATQRLYANRAFELWTKDGRTADLPVTKGDDYRWPRDVAGWATGLAGVDIAPCEALALALEEVLP